MNRSTRMALAGALSLSLIAAACGDDEDSGTTADTEAAAETTAAPAAETTAAAAADTTAAAAEETTAAAEETAVCPEKIVIQTDWWPELEHGGTYQLIGPDGTANAENFTYSGPIQEQYAAGGVTEVEIRAGGDAISFTPVTSEMYAKDEITFGYVNMSDAMRDSSSAAVVGVAKTLEINPQMVMWDPAQLEITAPEDMAASGANVLYFDGTTYMDYLEAQGYVTGGQLDPSYGGAPDQWIAQGGNFIQQGFATNEIYKYENEIPWKDGGPADVEYFLIHDLGFEDYPAMLSVRADKLEELTPCLEVLVPKLAQAWVDFLGDPTPMTDALIGINETYDTYWTVSAPLNETGLAILEEKGIGGNSADGTYCSLDDARVAGMAEILVPIFEADGLETADDLTAVVNNTFCAGAPGR
jgi:hypothetical protein